MNFIWVTQLGGRPMLINLEHVKQVITPDTHTDHGKLLFVDGTEITTVEDINTLAAAIPAQGA